MRILLVALLFGACGREPPAEAPVAIAPGTPTPGVAAQPIPPGTPTGVPTQAPLATPACIVGRWEANDFLSALRQQIRSDLQEARLTRASGTIRFELGELDGTGSGPLIATADDLVHRASVGQGGLRANVTHTLSGSATMSYRMPTEGQLLILQPTAGELSATVRWVVSLGKAHHGRQRSTTEPFVLTGLYAYECVADRLTIRRVEAPGRFGEMLTLDRAPEPSDPQ